MTTDVINGVPRSLLKRVVERCALVLSVADGEQLSTLLATAQPADHSEHDLNMVSQPAADGERESCSDCNDLGFGPFDDCGECDMVKPAPVGQLRPWR